MKIIDNYLPFEEHSYLKFKFLNPEGEFPWYIGNGIVNFEDERSITNNLENFQFTHLFHGKQGPLSFHYELIQPIIKKLKPLSIARIKANLLTVNTEIKVHGFHTDILNYNGKTAVYYVNSNNGFTVFQNGTKIESVENRMLIFDSNLYHSGTSCTDQRYRCVINFNFVPHKLIKWIESL